MGPRRPRKPNRTQQVEAAIRRAFLIDMRRMGGTYRQIAQAAIAEFGIDALPSHWDDRYVAMDIRRELQRLRNETAETAADVKDIEVARLDEMHSRVYPVALGNEVVPPDVRAVDRVLRIMERRAKLLGLDTPSDLDREIAAILATLAGGAQAQIAGGAEVGGAEDCDDPDTAGT